MATVSIRGKEKVITHFKNALNPHWKLYNASDLKSPIQSCLTIKDLNNSLHSLNEILDNIDPNGVYILDTFEKSDDRTDQKFLRPATSICFALSENAASTSVGTTEEKKRTVYDQPASLKDHISLIERNAKLEIECSLYKSKFEESLETIKELENEIDELEAELEEMEEDEEESVSGSEGVPKDLNQVIAKLVQDHGGTIIENFMDKGVKGGDKIKFDKDPDEEVKVSGTGDEMSLMQIIEELQKRDSQFQKHMYKLMLIAQQKPSTFKMFLKRLEEF